MLRLLAALALASGSLASNPLVPKAGMADTNVHYFNGTFMIFATHDFDINNTGFTMKDWWVWSSPDLAKWTLESVVSPATSLKWDTQSDECWATDASFVNDKLYFYVSAGGGQVAVMVADSIKGPWSDPLGKPLMSPAFGKAQNPPTTFRDPCVFLDPATGDYYMIAGVFEYYITKLNKDMISFAEKPRHVTFTNHVYGPCGDGKTDDKPFMHKNGDTYYLSWGCFYATGSSVYGPFTMGGSVIDTAKIAPDFQCDGQPHQCGAKETIPAMPRLDPLMPTPTEARAEALAAVSAAAAPTPWFLKEDYTDRHGSFLNHGGQWYYFSNDRSHSGDIGHEGVFRDTVGCYIHFRANGTMEPCEINAAGVNSHSLSHGSAIEAENFFTIDGGEKVDLQHAGGGEGFAVSGDDGATLRYPHVTGLTTPSALTLRAAASQPATVEIYANSTTGLLLARCDVPSTGGLAAYADVSCAAAPGATVSEELELVLVVKGASALRIDRFWASFAL